MMTRSLKLIGIAIATVLILWSVWQPPVPAQDVGNLSARISRLESENSGLRSRLSQIESQLSRVSNAAGIRYAQPLPPNNNEPGRGTLSSDPMFDRLATLAIEQRERMDQLEARLAAIESRLR